jgi:hypothetical protein
MDEFIKSLNQDQINSLKEFKESMQLGIYKRLAKERTTELEQDALAQAPTASAREDAYAAGIRHGKVIGYALIQELLDQVDK